jgi:hypothetical protein
MADGGAVGVAMTETVLEFSSREEAEKVLVKLMPLSDETRFERFVVRLY